jgi:hypothetical protein
MRVKSLAFIVLLISSQAAASNWVSLGHSNAVMLYIDTSSIRLDGNYHVAWIKTVSFTGSIKERVALNLFDCDGNRTAIKSLIVYNRDGTNQTFDWQDYQLEWTAVAPDTIGESAFNAVCR